MKRAFVISPYSGDTERNVKYARQCGHYCLSLGYAPFIGHIMYTQFLDDTIEKDRDFGMRAAYAFLGECHVAFCFLDLYVSRGMRADLDAAQRLEIPIEYTFLTAPAPQVGSLHASKLPHSWMACAECQDAGEGH